MKIDIKEKGDLIFVNVQVKPIHRRNYNVKIKVLTKDVLNHLEKQELKVGKCVKNPNLVTNLMTDEELNGEWIFEKIKPPAMPKPVPQIKKPSPKIEKPPRTKKRSKKVKKTLDKSPEDVIIYIQEETLPSKE